LNNVNHVQNKIDSISKDVDNNLPMDEYTIINVLCERLEDILLSKFKQEIFEQIKEELDMGQSNFIRSMKDLLSTYIIDDDYE
ncbi:MAG: hypothetical protein R3213_08290, partial [Flavobacteriaceae bacterium]|nr:hypothetical protein [Flavobacteriaceae bacterium]